MECCAAFLVLGIHIGVVEFSEHFSVQEVVRDHGSVEFGSHALIWAVDCPPDCPECGFLREAVDVLVQLAEPSRGIAERDYATVSSSSSREFVISQPQRTGRWWCEGEVSRPYAGVEKLDTRDVAGDVVHEIFAMQWARWLRRNLLRFVA